MNDRRQLLCTFSSLDAYKNTIEDLTKFYNVYNNRFFVFTNINDANDIFITYNILNDGGEFPKFKNTISIHRKKATSTIFTLNALNQLVKDENGGVLNKDFSVDWSLYKNSLIITGDPSIRVISIKILEITNRS